MWYEWFFDGIGTEIVGIIIGLVIGGTVIYKFVTRNKSKQKQIAGDKSKQHQEFEVEIDAQEEGKTKSDIKQIQKAGNGANQTQIGRIKNGSK